MLESIEKLLPCAHCGGKGELLTYYDFYRINCTNDDCVEYYNDSMVYRGEGAWYGSVADAIAAWNTRAMLGSGTCEVWHDGKMGRCSECRYENHYATGWKFWNYCPHCGAKVVDA